MILFLPCCPSLRLHFHLEFHNNSQKYLYTFSTQTTFWIMSVQFRFQCLLVNLPNSSRPSTKSALNEAHPSPVHRRVPGRSAQCCGKSNESQTLPARHLQRNRAARNGFKAGPTENMTPASCFSTGDSHQPPSRSQHVFPLRFCAEACWSNSRSCARV